MKRNYRKVPNFIWEKVNTLTSTDLVVACSKELTFEEISAGKWSHLGISIDGGIPCLEREILPVRTRGKYSLRNREGHVVVRKDLPKIWKMFMVDAPNPPNAGGTHTVFFERQVYERDIKAPQETTIAIEALESHPISIIAKFIVNQVMDRTASDFEERLLVNLNLLQENVGAIDVFPSNATRDAYLQTLHVDWELLPEGSKDLIIQKLTHGLRKNVEAVRVRIEARHKLLEEFQPENMIVGTSGFRRYFGAQFRADLVVFENVEYGNAMYVLFENWKDLSKLSRIELMERPSGLVRIVHKLGWELKLKKLLEEKIGPLDERRAA